MEIFIFWLILSFLAAVYAGSKGRSRFGWFCFSFLLSPLIGFVALAVFPSRSSNSVVTSPNPTRDQLVEIRQLLDEGLISQEEFAAKRKIILDQTN
jgi:hypothetical protein